MKKPFPVVPAIFMILLLSGGCKNFDHSLPILGPTQEKDGQTIHHRIPDFNFINQDSIRVDNKTFAEKVYIADFFFTSCPTICPKLTKQMLRIHDRFLEDDRLLLMSHTVDTKRDSVAVLKNYARNLGVKSEKWHFVTGPKNEIYDIANAYFNIVVEDNTLPGGYDHSGRLVLIDPSRHLRSFCNGTDEEDVNRFIRDIEKLLNEIEESN